MEKKTKGRKRRPRKPKTDPLVEAKKKALEKLFNFFQDQVRQYEVRVAHAGTVTCEKVRKTYNDKLKALSQSVRNITIAEYVELEQKKSKQEDTAVTNQESLRSVYEKNKLMSEKKKTLKKRQRSLSCNGANSAMSVSVLSRASRVLSEQSLHTPLSKRSVAPSVAIVTPKFNPKVPLPKTHLRKPRAGEVVMSMSGSPLLNVSEDLSDKAIFAMPLGDGKIIKITEDPELGKLEKEGFTKLDSQTKATLEIAKKKLDRILGTQ